jgi:dTDP-4-amino-4,6-dideoxygalactose transaminase
MVADMAMLLRNHGLKNRNESQIFSYNFRLDSIKAAVANSQIKDISRVTEKRNINARLYNDGLKGIREVHIPPRDPEVHQAFHTYVIQVDRRDSLMDFLSKKGIETKIHYPIPIHLMEAAARFGYKRGDFPVAESQAERIISLPINQYITNKQISYVIDTIREFYKVK